MLSQTTQYNISPDYARRCLEANKHNNVTATYYLLVKKYMSQGRKGIIDPNTSLDSKTLNASMKRGSADKRLGESMRIEGRRQPAGESFGVDRREYSEPRVAPSKASAMLEYLAAGRLVPRSGSKPPAKKTVIVDKVPAEGDSGYYKKRSEFCHYKRATHRLPAEAMMPTGAGSQQRRAANNRRNVSYRDRRAPADNVHNRTMGGASFEEDSEPRGKAQDWSFDVVTEDTGNAKLQKLFDLYHQPNIVHNGATDYANVFKKMHDRKASKPLDKEEDSPTVPQPPAVVATRKTSAEPREPPRKPRVATSQGRRAVHKSASPRSRIAPESRVVLRGKETAAKNTEEVAERKEGEKKPYGGNNGKKLNATCVESPKTSSTNNGQPITIIQTPQINNINNYNHISINTISINPTPPVAHPPAPPPPPVESGKRANNFRRRKYRLDESGGRNKSLDPPAVPQAK